MRYPSELAQRSPFQIYKNKQKKLRIETRSKSLKTTVKLHLLDPSVEDQGSVLLAPSVTDSYSDS